MRSRIAVQPGATGSTSSGEYVANSYAVFELGDRSIDPNDEKLQGFLDE